MEDKLDTLKILIENRAFAPTYSAYAKDLGYKGRAVIYRLMEGRVNDKTVNKIWEKTCKKYHIDENNMYRLAHIFYDTKYLYNSLVSCVNNADPEWIRILIMSFIDCSFERFPDSIREEADILKDLKLDEPGIYWGIVTVVYIWAKKIDIYKGSIESNFRSIINELDDILLNMYPEKQSIHEVTENLLSLNTAHNFWGILYNCVILFRNYTEDDIRDKVSTALYLFNFGKRSYWRKPGESYGQYSDVWLLVEQNFRHQTVGYYFALHLKAGKDIHTFLLDDVMTLQFLLGDDDEEMQILIASHRNSGKQEFCYYNFGYDEIKNELYFSADPETGNLLGLPDTLCMINKENPEGKDEKVWARIITEWDKHQGRDTFKQAKERLSGIIDMTDSYKIEEVSISRTLFILSIKHDGCINQYQLPIDKYEFLSEINPSQMVIVAKYQNDDELMVCWPELMYSIKLSEFEVK